MTVFLDALHQPHVQLLLRLLLGGLLLLAGLSKLAGRESFRAAVAEYKVLPGAFERPFATVVPWLEVGLGVALLLGLGMTAAAALAVPLFLSFGIAIGVNIARGRAFDCHCFGAVQRDPIGAGALARSLALAVAALVVAIGTSRFGALEHPLFGSSASMPSMAEIVPVVFLAALIIDVLVLLPETVAVRHAYAQRQRPQITGRAA